MPRPPLVRSLPTVVCTATLALAAFCLATVGCTSPAEQEAARKTQLRAQAQGFLDSYTAKYLELYYASNLAEWDSNTHIVEGDDTNRQRTEAANQALAAFTGAQTTIEQTRQLLAHEADLDPLQARQLHEILYKAANLPETVPDLVKRRIAAEAAQSEKLFGFDFKIDGESVSANDIDDRLASSTDPAERRKVWEASKEVGKGLKEGLTELVELRNGTVQALGYPDFFAYQVSDYEMSTDEMMALNHRFVEELWPLYRELHTWARHELAQRYHTEVPALLPAHWLPNRWGQDWSELVDVEGLDLDGALADKTPEWVVQQGEAFYVSLGFQPLPQSFWERSSLYPVASDAGYKKNNHASAWHLDLENDVRSLMSVQANARWWATVHHELGHVYYYQSYTRHEVPPLLRSGANRGFHEAVGTLMGIASMQKPFLVERGLIAADTPSDEIRALLKEALDKVVFIPFSAGTMTHFEHDLYTGLSAGEHNQRWWKYARGFQGIEPPEERGEEYCDAATKTHVNDDPAQYYDYALSSILLYQLHAHIAEKILGQDPRQTNYWGRKDVGAFLAGILELGATRDWRELMREKLGEELSAKPMLAYFEPLMAYLKEQNAGRTYTLPERPEV